VRTAEGAIPGQTIAPGFRREVASTVANAVADFLRGVSERDEGAAYFASLRPFDIVDMLEDEGVDRKQVEALARREMGRQMRDLQAVMDGIPPTRTSGGEPTEALLDDVWPNVA
jgi:hypothetical protein